MSFRIRMRWLEVNDDDATFAMVVDDCHYAVIRGDPFDVILSFDIGFALGSIVTYHGWRIAAICGPAGDPDFGSRDVAIIEHEDKPRLLANRRFEDHVLQMRVTGEVLIAALITCIRIWDYRNNGVRTINVAPNVCAPLGGIGDEFVCAMDVASVMLTHGGDENGTRIRIDGRAAMICFSGGDYVACVVGKAVTVSSVERGDVHSTCRRSSPSSQVLGMAFEPGGNGLAVLSANGVIEVFDAARPRKSIRAVRSHEVRFGGAARLAWRARGFLEVLAADGRLIQIALDDGWGEVGRRENSSVIGAVEAALSEVSLVRGRG